MSTLHIIHSFYKKNLILVIFSFKNSENKTIFYENYLPLDEFILIVLREK